MFYTHAPSPFYRMGDIIENLHEVIPCYDSKNNDFSVKFQITKRFVILTPCCSIEKKEAIVVPLKPLDTRLVVSEFLRDDFLLINSRISQKKVLGERAYAKALEEMVNEQTSPEEIAIFENSINYEFFELFVFGEHTDFEEYSVSRKRGKDDTITVNTKCYMISFKDAMRVQSLIFNRDNSRCAKLAELTPMARKALRDKLTFFYSRVPDEDKEYIT